MKKRYFIISMLALFILAVSITSLADFEEEDKSFGEDSLFGYIDMNIIKTRAPLFAEMDKAFKEFDREYEEFKATVYSQHAKQIKELTKEFEETSTGKKEIEVLLLKEELYKKAQELSLITQKKLDEKKKETNTLRQLKEEKINSELKLVIEKFIKKNKTIECILYKKGFMIGGRDVTEDLLKEWEKLNNPSFFQKAWNWIKFWDKDKTPKASEEKGEEKNIDTEQKD